MKLTRKIQQDEEQILDFEEGIVVESPPSTNQHTQSGIDSI